MNLLDNELIRKYFAVGKCLGIGKPPERCSHPNCGALRILQAMHQPIKEADLYLTIGGTEGIPEGIFEQKASLDCSILQPIHPKYLRLPDQFQKQEKKECEHPLSYIVKQQGWKRCSKCDEILEGSQCVQEINEAVARKLGWVIDKTSDFRPWYGRPNSHPASAMIQELPDYCNDIKAAWEIMESRKQYQYCGVRWIPPFQLWSATFNATIDETRIEQVAATAPMAICLAFLKLEEKGVIKE